MGAAFAYFTDVERSSGNTLSAGTLNIHISDDGSTYGNEPVTAVLSSDPGLVPGQSWDSGIIYIKNVGSIDIQRIYARFGALVEGSGEEPEPEGVSTVTDISKYIKLLYYAEKLNDGNWQYETFDDTFAASSPTDGTINGPTTGASNANAYLSYWAGRGAQVTADGVISLNDLVAVQNSGSGDYITSLCMLDGGNVAGPLHQNDVIAFKFGFQLLPETTNVYQGDTASFAIDFIAAQLATYPDDSLHESITEPLIDHP
jgi:hypothetical protein